MHIICYAQDPHPICTACRGHIVHPNNGTRTDIFVPCFEAVDAACLRDAATYAFCRSWLSMGGMPKSASMHHVIEVENWKLIMCAWTEPYKHVVEVSSAGALSFTGDDSVGNALSNPEATVDDTTSSTKDVPEHGPVLTMMDEATGVPGPVPLPETPDDATVSTDKIEAAHIGVEGGPLADPGDRLLSSEPRMENIG